MSFSVLVQHAHNHSKPALQMVTGASLLLVPLISSHFAIDLIVLFSLSVSFFKKHTVYFIIISLINMFIQITLDFSHTRHWILSSWMCELEKHYRE